jgi:hypothetical protein
MFPLVIVPNATLFIFIIAFYKGIGDSLEWTWARAVLGYRVGVRVVWRCSAGKDCVGHCRCRYMPAMLWLIYIGAGHCTFWERGAVYAVDR